MTMDTPQTSVVEPTPVQMPKFSAKFPLILIGLLLVLSAGAGGVYLGKYIRTRVSSMNFDIRLTGMSFRACPLHSGQQSHIQMEVV